MDRRCTILVVEDSTELRELAKVMLQSVGYGVVTAGNGDEALRFLRSHDLPDAIVLDLRMPVMDGWEFCAHERADPLLRHIPVIVFSSEPMPAAATASDLGVASVIAKQAGARHVLDALHYICR